ncbi:MAG: FAD-dependent oxidoreductase [Firmicutes bacterium]|nr:FAD-dependent oxidoreductase [Bacillota bacterium]
MSVTEPLGSVLVVGGGIAGMQAALDLAEGGYFVHLVTSGASLGGRMAQLDKTFPTNDCAMCLLGPRMTECLNHPNIQIHTLTTLQNLDGGPGHFRARLLRRPRYVDEKECTGCGDCTAVCPVEVPDEFNLGLSRRKAIHRPFPQAVPNKFLIDKRGKSPCQQACPSGVNPHGYVALVREGKYVEAWRLIRRAIPFPIICGTVCHHPCETVCQRGTVDEPVAKSRIKRFVGEYVLRQVEDLDRIIREDMEPPRPEKVAVVGSGPAGMACAYHLARRGYPVTVFEALSVLGGMLRVGIPPYRLPKDLLDAEIDLIRRMGVEFRTGVAVGPQLPLMQLFEMGFRAVFLGIGAHEPLFIGLPGENLPGVYHGVTFLRLANLGQPLRVGKQVAVIGGGNTAIDAARTALRLGAEEVTVYYRRSPEEMTALPEEVEEAREEGVRFVFLVSPVAVLGDGRARAPEDGHRGEDLGVTGLRLIRNRLGDPDARGHRRPVPIPGSELEVPCQTVITAVSQAPDQVFLADSGLIRTPVGTLVVDPVTLATNLPGVFAGGDAVTGPATVIEAMAAGKEAAESIHRFLQGEDLRAGRSARPLLEEIAHLEFDTSGVARQRRVRPRKLDPASRVRSFAEVVLPYTEEEARREASRCLDCGICSECLQCESACQKNAVRHGDGPATVELEVGAVVLAPGFDLIDAATVPAYGHGIYRNVVTGQELERLLSATGPTGGHVERPSDGKVPHRVAFIQCAGSRDDGHIPYCSSVCCMYATKQAIMVKDHHPETEITVFYGDLRAVGKGFEKYLLSAEGRGVRYLPTMISTLKEDPVTGNLVIRYWLDGRLHQEEFDLVVLATAARPPAAAGELARAAGIALDRHGFAAVDPLAPVKTSREGVFAVGGFTAPRDIPESVMMASAAAAQAGTLLRDARGKMIRKKEYPPPLPVAGQPPRVGVFVCHCGTNIASVVDVEEVARAAATLPEVVHAEATMYACSQAHLGRIRELIAEKGLNRVVVASCTIRTHRSLFQETLREAGLNPFLFEMANIREQCSWVHRDDPAAATAKATDLVRMAVAKVARAEPLTLFTVPVIPRALVLGGGLAGMQAALSLADQGFHTYLVERQPELGGILRRLHSTLEAGPVAPLLADLRSRVLENPRIEVFTGTQLLEFSGHAGHYRSVVHLPDGSTREIEHGALVLATGTEEYRPTEYLYGEDPRILTRLEFEELLASQPHRVRDLGTMVFIGCVGSRTTGQQYCSRTCCSQTVKNALRVKELNPDAQVIVLYRDIRTYGTRELYYREARRRGVSFLRYRAEEPPRVGITGAGDLTLAATDVQSGRRIAIHPDLVVLSTAAVPAEGVAQLASLLKVPLDEHGFFLELHPKMSPMDLPSHGIYVCGAAHAPKSISETIFQAQGAAARAASLLAKEELLAGGIVATVTEEKCAACLTCVRVCPYRVPFINQRNVAQIDPVQCRGCGTCAAECPGAAITLPGYRKDQLAAMLTDLFAEVPTRTQPLPTM